MTDTIAHPPLPEPAAHIFPAALERFREGQCHSDAYSMPICAPDVGSTVPLFTAQQMREYRGAPSEQSGAKP